ncbi:MAG: hypothetical protein WC468_02740 [Candidatus Paceibacterota bacterium]
MQELNKDNKINILLSALEERYNSLSTIRERTHNIGIWSLGILLGASGWLIESGITLSILEKKLYLVGIIIAFIILRFHYLKDLQVGFRSQQRITVKIEKALHLFDQGFFDDSEESIYPKSWEKSGTKDGKGKFFETNFALLYIGMIFLIISIITNGCL